MKMKMLFIYNPQAGKALIRNKLSDIVELFSVSGYEVTIYPTRKKKDASNIVKSIGSRFDYIVCAGGDGTLNEVTDGLMALSVRPPCGYIPAGTVNDFASSMKLPKNILKAAKIVVEGEIFSYDIGSLNGDFFTYFAGFGAFTEVSYETSQAFKNILGKMAYFLEGMTRIPNIKSYNMRVESKEVAIEGEFIFGMITNSHSVGGFKGLSGTNIKLNDGLFEVALIKMPKNPVELQTILNALVTKELNNKYMYSFRTADIKFICKEKIAWTVDGEYGGNFKEVNIVNLKGAICYVK
jgi:diacylglycerol kinase (ATP)